MTLNSDPEASRRKNAPSSALPPLTQGAGKNPDPVGVLEVSVQIPLVGSGERNHPKPVLD